MAILAGVKPINGRILLAKSFSGWKKRLLRRSSSRSTYGVKFKRRRVSKKPFLKTWNASKTRVITDTDWPNFHKTVQLPSMRFTWRTELLSKHNTMKIKELEEKFAAGKQFRRLKKLR
jgi:hypothetical protein